MERDIGDVKVGRRRLSGERTPLSFIEDFLDDKEKEVERTAKEETKMRIIA